MNGYLFSLLALAVIVFWSVGAYNRLVRLRAQTSLAFIPVSQRLISYVEWVQTNASLMNDAGLTELMPGQVDSLTQAWIGVDNSAKQFEASLKIANQQPLNATTMQALQTALSTLWSSWERLQSEPPDLAGQRVPEILQQEWQRIAGLAAPACTEFNRMVDSYNEAIAQFPAVLIAVLAEFKPAKTL